MASILYAPLLQRLQRQGFIVTADQYCLIRILLERLGPDCGPTELRDVLGPVLAKTPEQQQIFRREFDWYLSLRLLAERSTDDPRSQPRPDKGTPSKQRFTGRRRILIGVLLAGAIAVAAALVQYSPRAARAIRTPIPGQVGAVEVGGGTGLQILLDRGVAVMLLAFLAAIWYIMIRPDLPLRSARANAPPYFWPLRLLADVGDWQTPEMVKSLRSAMSARKETERRRVDWEATVRATVARMGWPDVRFTQLRVPSDYVFLIERRSSHDHLARFYAEALLQIEDTAQVSWYFYDGTPNSCYVESPAAQIPLLSIARGHPEGAVIVLGSAANLIDPVTGRLDRWTDTLKTWQDRAVLVADQPTPIELAELKTHTWLSVALGTLEEIKRIARATDFGGVRLAPGTDRNPLESGSWVPSDVERLRKTLGLEVFRWLCACALHHEVSWSVSIRLSRVKEVMSTPPSEVSMFAMFRLPWFRLGAMSMEMRDRLSKELPKDVEIAARRAIIELLRESKPPESSYARLAVDFDIRAHEAAIVASQSRDRLGPRVVTGRESSSDFVASPTMVRLLRSSEAARNITDWAIAATVATVRFIMHDYGDEDNIFFILLASYVALFAVGLFSLFA